MCKCLVVSRHAYYKWKKKQGEAPKASRTENLKGMIKDITINSNGSPDCQLFQVQLEWESLNGPKPASNGQGESEWRNSVLAGGELVLPGHRAQKPRGRCSRTGRRMDGPVLVHHLTGAFYPSFSGAVQNVMDWLTVLYMAKLTDTLRLHDACQRETTTVSGKSAVYTV